MPMIAPALGSIALNLAIGVGASVLSMLLKPQKAQQPQVQTQQVTTRSGMSFELEVGEATAVSSILGLARATGQLLYINEFGANNEYVQFAIKIGHGWHDGLEHFLVDEKQVSLSGSNSDSFGRSVVEYTREGTPYLWVKYYTGAPGQSADPELVSRANPAGRWTSAHRVTGCAYMIITCRYDAGFYGNSVPRFGSVWRGLRVYDWRVPGAVWGDQNTYIFSRNPAVLRYNFRRGVWVNGVRVIGQGFSSLSCDLPGYTAAANRCDEPFFDPVTNTTFPVFAYGRQISDDEEKMSVLKEMEDSYCGSSFKRGGADVPLPAQQMISVMTLSDTDRVIGESVNANKYGSVSQKRTMWHGQFVSYDMGWAESPYNPRIDTDLESLIGGRRAAVMDQPYESLQARAQLRAEIALRRQFFPSSRTEVFTPKALVLEPGDAVTRVCEWGSMLMIVEKTEVLQDRTGVRITLTQWDNSIVPASGDTFVALPSQPGPVQSPADRTIAVSGFTIVPYQRLGGGAEHPFASASWIPITDQNVDQVMIVVWPSAGSEEVDGEEFFVSSRLQSVKLFGPLQPLTDYSGYAIPIRSDTRRCVRTSIVSFTTGDERSLAVVADNSITPAMLAQELQNERGYLMAGGTGTLAERLAEFELKQAQADAAALTDQANSREKLTVLKASVGSSLAAITEVRRVIAESNAALAELIDEVAVELTTLTEEIVENLTAGGLFQITAQVDGTGAQAEILMKVRAAVNDMFGEAALRLKAEADGVGGSIGYVDIMADRLRFISTAGGVVTIPFKIELVSGVPTVVMQDLRFRTQRSIAEVGGQAMIELNGDDGSIIGRGAFSFGV